MELISQPFHGQLGDRLIELLGSSDYHTFNLAVAFAKSSGVLRMKEALEEFRASGGSVNAYVGIDLGGTSYEALTALSGCTDNLWIVHSENGQTFHSKIYHLIGHDLSTVIVGSQNLTGGGLWGNFETSVLINLENEETMNSQYSHQIDGYFQNLNSLGDSIFKVNCKDDLDILLERGYVLKEAHQTFLSKNAHKKNFPGKPIFGKGLLTKLPNLKGPADAGADPSSNTAAPNGPDLLDTWKQNIWFETRSMTGGSRNILDLSMKSLISQGDPKGTLFDMGDPKYVRGTVEFFGMHPADTNKTKEITINFDGFDFHGNKILFPTGDKANGTWRLQIKGINSSVGKITEFWRDQYEEHYLVDKILHFIKVEDTYYSMSVFPKAEIGTFIKNSRVLGRNGATSNAKQFGLL